MLFGTNNNNFNSIEQSLLTLFLISIGSMSVFNIQTFNLIERALFSVSYLLINLMLLNMLVAIIVSHYLEYYVEMGSTKSKVISLFFKMISGSLEVLEKIFKK